jgi:hypothetical protein
VSAYLVVVLSVLASAAATLTLNLLARLDWRHARAWTRPAADGSPEPAGLLEPRQGPCGCLTVTGAIALLHEQGYLPFGQLGSGGELLANGEAAAAVWPAPPDRIAAVQFGTLSLGPPTSSPPVTSTPPPSWPPATPTGPPSPTIPRPTRPPSPRCSSWSTRYSTRHQHSMLPQARSQSRTAYSGRDHRPSGRARNGEP